MRIGLFGYGVVGGGLDELAQSPRLLSRGEVDIARVFVRKERGELGARATADMEDILADETIDAVAEAMVGTEPARTVALRAMAAGKHVVTANKLMLSEHYAELMTAARENGVTLAFSACVGGGVPFLVNLIHAGSADDILSLGGVMNGTTNYILSAMAKEGADFAAALSDAQRLGYAEADPSADIDGLDARCKLSLSASVAWGGPFAPRGIPALGIRNIRAFDITLFGELGLCCKLIARAQRTARGVAAFVLPCLLPTSAPEAVASGTGNSISYTGARFGMQSFMGLGAGKNPTAHAMYRDLAELAAGASPFHAVLSDFRAGEPLVLDDENGPALRAYVRTEGALPDAFAVEKRLRGGAYLIEPLTAGALVFAMGELLQTDAQAFAAAIPAEQ